MSLRETHTAAAGMRQGRNLCLTHDIIQAEYSDSQNREHTGAYQPDCENGSTQAYCDEWWRKTRAGFRPR